MAKNRSSKGGFIAWLRNHPIIANLLGIVLLFLCLAVVAFVAMALGTRHDARRTVPDFVGLTMEDATYFAERRDLQIIVNDSLHVSASPGGVVLEQLPAKGTVVKPGRKVYVTVNALAQRRVEVPYVAGRSLRQAKHLLEASGFTIAHLEYVEDIATNYVLGEFLGENEILEDSVTVANIGSAVVLRVGLAPSAPSFATPQLLGLSLYEAKSRLWESGLNVGEIVFDESIPPFERGNTKVYAQSVFPGREIRYGERVSLNLTLETEKVENSIVEYERRVEEEAEAKRVADSIALAEKRLLDSVATAERANSPQPSEDNFFF